MTYVQLNRVSILLYIVLLFPFEGVRHPVVSVEAVACSLVTAGH